MNLAMSIALILLGAVAGSLVGVAIVGPVGAIAGVLPPTAVAAWGVWRGHTRETDMQRAIIELQAETEAKSMMMRQSQVSTIQGDSDQRY